MTPPNSLWPATLKLAFLSNTGRPFSLSGSYSRERGTSMVEFSLIALPLIFTGVGVLELTHWIYVRQAVGAALNNAAKAGSAQHANPTAIAQAFEHNLLVLHPTRTNRANPPPHIAAQQSSKNHEQTPWHIQVRSPSVAVFSDFAKQPGSAHTGSPRIRNSYQQEQHANALHKGWKNGVGPNSGETIFQANTLSLQLSYPYAPLVPGLSAVLPGPLVIRREVRVVMHSDPVLWPDNTHTRVTRGLWQNAAHNVTDHKIQLPNPVTLPDLPTPIPDNTTGSGTNTENDSNQPGALDGAQCVNE